MNDRHCRITTPGRICLFGEHQDYLRLPVIPCAISLRIGIDGMRRNDRNVSLAMPDIGGTESFSLEGPLAYTVERDYFRSVVNVLRREGFTFSGGFDCVVRGNIPINSGTSSSSALIVTWVNFLARMSDQARTLDPEACATYAHAAEVLEFGEPGGMMDHVSTAFGGTIYLEFHPRVRVERLPVSFGTFVLGDSGEPKDTKSILARVKNQVIDVSRQMKSAHPEFSLHTVMADELDRYRKEMTGEQLELLRGTLRNRDITQTAHRLLIQPQPDHRQIGALLDEHQSILRDVLKISTPKIDRMIDAARHAGAPGGKINGSGGGGCMFAYAPEDPERVAEAITNAGGRAYIVTVDGGTRQEQMEVLP